ncbi:DLW-39 family protein [Pseudonocardia sp.]|nr:DLW-39 family protein [Pseudonocardia sp.]
MKKLLTVVVALAAGAVVFSKIRGARAESDLWHEATNR